MGLKREDRPAAFAGRSESVFWIFCSSAGGIPLVPTQASILSHSRAPSTPQASHTGKESENAAGEKADTFGGKQCDPLQYMLASGAFQIENPDKVGDGKATALAAVERVLKAYQAILKQKPDAKASLSTIY